MQQVALRGDILPHLTAKRYKWGFQISRFGIPGYFPFGFFASDLALVGSDEQRTPNGSDPGRPTAAGTLDSPESLGTFVQVAKSYVQPT